MENWQGRGGNSIMCPLASYFRKRRSQADASSAHKGAILGKGGHKLMRLQPIREQFLGKGGHKLMRLQPIREQL